MTVQQRAAVALADRGFWVFPLVSGHKEPAIKAWQHEATRDYGKISGWWGANPHYNVGIFTGKYGDNGALIAIDVDIKNGGHGDVELLRLELEGLDFPDTYTQTTPTSGRHLVYQAGHGVRSGANVLGKNLDLRSAGGYIVGAGSVIGSTMYRGSHAPVSSAPDWLLTRTRPAQALVISQDIQADLGHAYARAKAYLATAPVAVQGAGGDHQTYCVAARVKDYGVPEAVCVALMDAGWNQRCEPPWSFEELETKVKHAYRYGNNPVGIDAPEAVFTPAVQAQQPNVGPIEKINQSYAYVIASGGQHILWETTDSDGHAKLEHLTLETFHGKFAAERVQTGDGSSIPLSKMWFSSPQRRSYDGLVFAPEQPTGPRFFNLWKGFAYEPAPTGQHPMVSRFLEHAFENVCRGNQKYFDWLITYFAHLIQKPWEKPLVALVFRGQKGVGKNALIERIGALLGGHFLLSATRRYLIGNFNSHLERLLLFVLDEAFWSGDKQSEGVLKDLITGREHLIERKGYEPYTVANKTRICIIGNEDWIVPTSHDERRFACFDVGDQRRQDTQYFQAMREGMEAGGYSNLLTYLKTHPLKMNVNIAPQTEALTEQKYQSLDPALQWWFDSLQEGRLIGSGETTWSDQVTCESVRFAFRSYTRQRNIQSRLPDDRSFGRQITKASPSMKHRRSSREIDGERPYVYAFESLETHRREWENYIGQAVKWD